MEDESSRQKPAGKKLARKQRRMPEPDETVASRQTEHPRNLYDVLRALRGVNQLITREKDRERLIQQSCQLMVETRGFLCAWILLLDENGKYLSAAAVGGKKRQAFFRQLEQGSFPQCVDRILGHKDTFATCEDIVEDRPGCLPGSFYSQGRGLISRLEYEGKVYGIISVYVPPKYARDPEEQALFRELAGDIAFALSSLESEEARLRGVEALRESEARYRTTLDSMMEGCQIIGYDWRYLYVNDAVVRHGRTTREQLLGKTMMECYPGIEKTEMFARLRRCIEKRVPSRMENLFTFPDGSPGWFELSIEPVPEGIFILSLDITERKRAEKELRESEVKYRELADSVPQIIVETDEKGDLEIVNRQALQSTGYTPSDVSKGLNATQLVIPEDRDRIKENIQRVLS